jgi:hypothetical protein
MGYLVGALPVILAGFVVLFFADRANDPNGVPTRVRAHKTGDEVVFTIANGQASHVIYKSNVPNKFDASSGVRVRNGTYRDSADDGSGLVFYRID